MYAVREMELAAVALGPLLTVPWIRLRLSPTTHPAAAGRDFAIGGAMARTTTLEV